ncbi:Uu.00g001300.m01.CDS01 [Anthostomella pinea]|uniref:Uu.00g001300.m01.CDS01 n=1 Tax=Anthostomella pinea TaxID=933095 RepID=A0AAI8YIE3_9PEZI|nr:Uu.00g001300.m01.CDS01 [Anthostomella pinea]
MSLSTVIAHAAAETDSEDAASSSDHSSDSLDSSSSRKKRKLSEPAPEPAQLSSVNAPSRIKRKQAPNATSPSSSKPAEIPSEGPITVPIDHNTTFESLQLKPWLVQSLANMAIRRPTSIQRLTIPAILEGRDVIGTSRTGSGKTVAFVAPILQTWAQDPSSIYAVILTATRELALQIYEQVKAISATTSFKALLVTGGSDMRAQAISLAQRPHMVIATAGRLAEHIRMSGEDTIAGLRRVRYVVLDEADRLLAAGGPGSMLPDIEECLGVLPPSERRQTLLYTATITPEVRALKDMPPKPGKKPAMVCEVDTQKLAVPDTLHLTYIQVHVNFKEYYLHAFLLTEANVEKSMIIFCNRTSTAERLHHLLFLLEHRVTSLHSKLPGQRQRTDNLMRFRAGAARILVATDVASRGLDIPEVEVVVNYDLPQEGDDFIHRVGRTARAGRKGEAVTLVGQRGVDRILAIEKRVGKKMEEWKEEGVNLTTRVTRDYMKVVAEKKLEANLNIEEHREVGGKRKRQKLRLE